MIKKRCSSCGRRFRDRKCSNCGSDRYNWEFAIDIGIRGSKRQQIRRTGFPTKTAAQTALVELQRSLDTGTFITPSKMTVGEYLDQWATSRQSQVRPSTAAAYEAIIELHLKPQLGEIPLQALNSTTIEAFYQELLGSGRKNGPGGLSPKSVRNVHVTLRKALADAERKGLIARNPAAAADPPRTDPRQVVDVRTWTAGQLRAFLEAVALDRLYAALHLAATTGMRRGEILGLRWQDVDSDHRRISVRQTLISVNNTPIFSTPKTKRSIRSISIDSTTAEALSEHRARQLREEEAYGPSWESSGLVFTREDGGPLHPDSFSKHFGTLIRRTGMPRCQRTVGSPGGRTVVLHAHGQQKSGWADI